MSQFWRYSLLFYSFSFFLIVSLYWMKHFSFFRLAVINVCPVLAPSELLLNTHLPTSEGWIAELTVGLWLVVPMTGFEPTRVDLAWFEHCALTTRPHHHNAFNSLSQKFLWMDVLPLSNPRLLLWNAKMDAWWKWSSFNAFNGKVKVLSLPKLYHFVIDNVKYLFEYTMFTLRTPDLKQVLLSHGKFPCDQKSFWVLYIDQIPCRTPWWILVDWSTDARSPLVALLVWFRSCIASPSILRGDVAESLRRSGANLVRSSVLGSSSTVGTILPQANSQLSCPSFRGR